jgi:hypothetical protein
VPSTPTHPSWCEYPHAPDDDTHTHTAAVGTARFAGSATADVVLVQTPSDSQPTVTLHMVTPTGRLSIAATRVEAWALAGVLIDATVAHAQAASSRSNAAAPVQPVPPRPGPDARPLWLLDGHPNPRMSRARTRRSFRCPPRRQPTTDNDGREEADDAE